MDGRTLQEHFYSRASGKKKTPTNPHNNNNNNNNNNLIN